MLPSFLPRRLGASTNELLCFDLPKSSLHQRLASRTQTPIHKTTETMTRENQLTIDEREGYFFCSPCNRYFRSQHGALQRARTATVHQDEWCDRCEWLFVSPAALDSHLANSRLHLVCEHCDEDVGDADDLDNHVATEHNEEYSESESNNSTESDPRAV